MKKICIVFNICNYTITATPITNHVLLIGSSNAFFTLDKIKMS